MQINILASGSSGNASVVSHGDTHILIDAGISMKRIAAGLMSLGLCPQDIDGVLITHEHSDHIYGLTTMSKRHGLTIYAPRTILTRIRGSKPETEEFLAQIPVNEEIYIGEISVCAFNTPHDTAQSVGYRLCADDNSLGYATDMGHISDEVLNGLLGCECVVVESNHDEQMLRYGEYPAYLKRRVLSGNGHLSNKDCGKLAVQLAQNGTKTIVLAHLSKENNTPRCAFETVSAALEDSGVGDVDLYVAHPTEMLRPGVDMVKKCLA